MNHAASQRNSKLESHPRGWHGVARRLQSESGLWNYRWIPRTRSAFHLSCSSITQRASDVSRGCRAGEFITAPISLQSDWRCQASFGLARGTDVRPLAGDSRYQDDP